MRIQNKIFDLARDAYVFAYFFFTASSRQSLHIQLFKTRDWLVFFIRDMAEKMFKLTCGSRMLP
jgi:hypothetical protein